MTTHNPAEKKLLLDLLDQWSMRHSLQEDPYLNSIRKTVANDAPLDVWTELDPQDHLPRPLSEEGSIYIRVARYLAIFRNVLVFAPVALTWKAVSEATTAFASFIGSQSAAPVNFLEFWQNGYGILNSRWRIGTVAEIDFLLIVVIIISTLLSTILLNYGRARDSRIQKLYDQEREVVIFEIKSYLFSSMGTSIEAVDSSLRKSLQNLNAAAQTIANAAKKLEQSMISHSKVITESQKVSKEVNTFQSRILKVLKKDSQ